MLAGGGSLWLLTGGCALPPANERDDKDNQRDDRDRGADNDREVRGHGEPIPNEQRRRPGKRRPCSQGNGSELAALIGHARLPEGIALLYRSRERVGKVCRNREVVQREACRHECRDVAIGDGSNRGPVLGKPHGHAAELVAIRDHSRVLPSVEAPVDEVAHAVEVRGRLAVAGVVGAPQRDGGEVAAVLLGAGHEALAALQCVARLSRGHKTARIRVACRVDEEVRGLELACRVLVRRGQLPRRAAGDLAERGLFQRRLKNAAEVTRGGVVVVIVQAAGVCEVRVLAAELGGLLVHEVNEALPGPAHMAGEHVRSVVAGRKQQAGQQVLHRYLLSGLDAAHHAVLAELREIVRLDRDHIVEARALEHEQRGHDLGRRGREAPRIGVLGKKHLSVVAIDQKRCRGVRLGGCGGVHQLLAVNRRLQGRRHVRGDRRRRRREGDRKRAGHRHSRAPELLCISAAESHAPPFFPSSLPSSLRHGPGDSALTRKPRAFTMYPLTCEGALARARKVAHTNARQTLSSLG